MTPNPWARFAGCFPTSHGHSLGSAIWRHPPDARQCSLMSPETDVT